MYFRKLGKSDLNMSVITPVSYTHLDVYKRQTKGCAKRGSATMYRWW